MSYAIYKGEKNLKDLVSRLFQLPDKTAKTAKQAQDALVKANPALKDISNIPAGTVLSVPPDAPPLKSSERAPTVVSRQIEINRQSEAALYQVDQAMNQFQNDAIQALQKFATALQSDRAQALAQKAPDLKEQLPSLIKSTQTIGKQLEHQGSETLTASFRMAPQDGKQAAGDPSLE